MAAAIGTYLAVRLCQIEGEDVLVVVDDLPRGHEAERFVEAPRGSLTSTCADLEYECARASLDVVHDLRHRRLAVASPLVTLVHELSPQHVAGSISRACSITKPTRPSTVA